MDMLYINLDNQNQKHDYSKESQVTPCLKSKVSFSKSKDDSRTRIMSKFVAVWWNFQINPLPQQTMNLTFGYSIRANFVTNEFSML